MKAFAIFVLLTAASLRSEAHEMPSGFHYAPECCHDRDCFPVPPGEVIPFGQGYLITRSKEYWLEGDSRIHDSPDGQYHRCTSKVSYCIYVPRALSF